jgi:SAM-dependent methyltransferase
MSGASTGAARWDEWNLSGGPRYPHDQAVRFVFRAFPPDRRVGVRALDLGCGGGVHTEFLAREGFQVLATDISSVGLEATRKRLAAAGLSAELQLADLAGTSLPERSLDLVLCVSVLDSAGPEASREGVARAARSLKPGGRGFFLFAAEGDFRLAGANPWRLHGYTEAEVRAVFDGHGLATVELDTFHATYRGGRDHHREWMIGITH